MARHLFSVFCRKALVDKETNTLSLFEVVDALLVSGTIPKEGAGITFPVELVNVWMKSDLNVPEKRAVRAQLVTPSKTFTSDESTLDLTTSQRVRWTFRMLGVPFYGEGTYWVNVQTKGTDDDKWTTDARVPLPVIVSKGGQTAKDAEPVKKRHKRK